MRTYRTPDGEGSGQYREKGSKFLGFAYGVRSEEQIRFHLEDLKSKYFDARHWCYAWILDPEGKVFRANDDGEPHHSAGDPILGAIRARNLREVLVVVVRYFGGVKLGVGGLVKAYRMAADLALDGVPIRENEFRTSLNLLFPYEATAEVSRLIREFRLEVLEQDFSQSCRLKVSLQSEVKVALLDRVATLQAMGKPILTEENDG